MGLEAYIDYTCSFRPEGSYAQIMNMRHGLRMLAVMQQHGVPSVTMRVVGPTGPEEREVTRQEAEQQALAMGHLENACAQCPAASVGGTPACNARVSYPLDATALTVLREALEANAADFSGDGAQFIQSLMQAGNCDGNRMATIVRNMQQEPEAAGMTPVLFPAGDKQFAVTPYMLLEHMFFRPRMDSHGVRALREFYRCFHIAVGNRVADGPGDHEANADALFGGSPSLQELARLGALVKAAEAGGWGMLLDG